MIAGQMNARNQMTSQQNNPNIMGTGNQMMAGQMNAGNQMMWNPEMMKVQMPMNTGNQMLGQQQKKYIIDNYN